MYIIIWNKIYFDCPLIFEGRRKTEDYTHSFQNHIGIFLYLSAENSESINVIKRLLWNKQNMNKNGFNDEAMENMKLQPISKCVNYIVFPFKLLLWCVCVRAYVCGSN